MKYLITVLRFIKGYVVFTAEKGFLERFINLCGKNGIYLWNISVDERKLTAATGLKSFKRIRSVAHKSGVRISIENKYGLIFRYRKYNKRIGIAFGILVFLIFHLAMNQFVWCIDVNGTNVLSPENLVMSAEKFGLHHGTIKKTFDEVRASRRIAAEYKGKIPWLSVNIKGSMAIIELREDNNPIKETESEEPCNIIADFDGVILSTETFRGDLQVKGGSAVKKGDLLISGIIENEDLTSDYYKAKGDITAIRTKELSIKEKNAEKLKIEIKRSFYSIGFLGNELPIKIRKEKKNNLFCDKIFLKVNGYELPFFICRYTEINQSGLQKNESKEYIYHLQRINEEKIQFNSNSTILSENENLIKRDSFLVLKATYETIDFIGKEEKILSVK